jgi:hypothetical protein
MAVGEGTKHQEVDFCLAYLQYNDIWLAPSKGAQPGFHQFSVIHVERFLMLFPFQITIECPKRTAQ